jgi:hypothetical protein
MHFYWILLGFVLAVLIFFAWRSTRSVENPFSESVSQHTPPVDIEDALVPASPDLQVRKIREIREMRWISLNGFRRMLSLDTDLLVIDHLPVIDSSPEAQKAELSLPDAFVLPLAPTGLVPVLQSFPDDQSVVLYGASSLCVFLIGTGPCRQGSAPFYLLEGSLRSLEAA